MAVVSGGTTRWSFIHSWTVETRLLTGRWNRPCFFWSRT